MSFDDDREADPLERIVAALDRWQAAGRRLTLWWRDDDAVEASPALERLVALARGYELPLALAVVPAGATAGLARRLDGERVHVLQHGFRHANHALPGGRAVECGGGRETGAILAEFHEGYERLGALFGERFLPVMVPPWNRIEDRVRDALAASGYAGLSGFGAGDGGRADGLVEANAHLDVLRWKTGPRFAGGRKLADAMVAELGERLSEPGGRPYGLLTHHLVHDAETWAFLEALLPRLSRHPAVRWTDAAALFRAGEAG